MPPPSPKSVRACNSLDVCKKNRRVNIFGSFLVVRQNAEWPRCFGPPGIVITSSGNCSSLYDLSLRGHEVIHHG